jgi:hypothetical protein
MADTTPDPQVKGEPTKSETGYLLVVCVLLVVISVSLTWLWQTQKKRTQAAQQALIEQRKADPFAQFLGKVQEMRPPVIQGGAPETIQFAGHPTPLYKIDPEEGKRLGFEPGDLILVLKPTAQPTSTSPPTPEAK